MGTPQTSAARRAAFSVLMCWPVGISTLPPRWPHFFSEASWSSQCTPAAPAAIMPFISSNAFSTPPKPASASATIGASQYGADSSPSAQVDLVGAQQRVVDPPHDRGDRVGRVEALVGVGLAAEVGVGRDLPAGQVDRLEPGADLLHRLVAGQRAEGVDVVLVVQQCHSRSAPRRARVCSSCTDPGGGRRPRPCRSRSIPFQRGSVSHWCRSSSAAAPLRRSVDSCIRCPPSVVPWVQYCPQFPFRRSALRRTRQCEREEHAKVLALA